MNITIKYLATCLLAILLQLPAMATTHSDIDKEKKKQYEKIELQLIEKYLAEQESTVELIQDQVIKVYNDNNQLEYKGHSDCKKSRKMVRKSNLLVETEAAKIYLTED